MILFFIIPALVLLSFLASAKPQTATLLLAALIPAYLIKLSVIGIPTNLFELSAFTVFSFSFVQKTIRRKWQIVLKQTPAWTKLLIALFVLSSVISTLISPHLRASLGIFKGWIVAPLLVGWLVYVFSRTDNKNNFFVRLLRSLVLSGLAVSLFGLTQINQMERIQSIYHVSNSLALYITPLLVIAFYLTIAGYKKVFFLPATIIISSTLIATQSVSGIIAAAISMLTGIIVHYLTKKASLNMKTIFVGIALVFLFITASIYVITATGRLDYLTQSQSDPDKHNSISVRLQLWSVSFELIKQNSFLGVGLGAFEPAYQEALHLRFSRYNKCKTSGTNCIQPIPEFVYRDPHNWPLSFWLNTGLIGLLGFISLNGIILWKTTILLRSMPRNTKHALITAAALALMSSLLFGLADTIYWKNDLAVLYWVLIGLLLSAQTQKDLNPKNTTTFK